MAGRSATSWPRPFETAEWHDAEPPVVSNVTAEPVSDAGTHPGPARRAGALAGRVGRSRAPHGGRRRRHVHRVRPGRRPDRHGEAHRAGGAHAERQRRGDAWRPPCAALGAVPAEARPDVQQDPDRQPRRDRGAHPARLPRPGVPAVVAYSEADRDTLAVRMADEAICIGPSEARKSYLNQPAVVSAADHHRLRRDPSRLRVPLRGRRLRRGLRGARPAPSSARGRRCSSGSAASTRCAACWPPTGCRPCRAAAASSPIYATRSTRPQRGRLPGAAQAVGRRRRPWHAAGALAARDGDRRCRSRAPRRRPPSATTSVYFEKWIEESRHVEVQVLVDQHGNGVHLGERDCSIQRRHQKIIEEAPSPAMDDAARERLRDLAIRAVVAAGYESAGTLEFLLDERRQLLLHRDQLPDPGRAPGDRDADRPGPHPAADPARVRRAARAAPGAGPPAWPRHRVPHQRRGSGRQLLAADRGWSTSCSCPAGPGVRVDTHLYPGYEVPPFYDSLLAKLIVWGETRDDRAGARATRPGRVPGRRHEDQPALPSWDDRQRRLPGGARSAPTCSTGLGRRPSWLAAHSVMEPMRRYRSRASPHRCEAADIMRILPHRYPFLLVDRVIELEPGKRAVGDQERDRQRAAVHRALPRAADHARRPDGRGAGADLRRGGADARRIPRQDSASSQASTTAASAAWCCPATRWCMKVDD